MIRTARVFALSVTLATSLDTRPIPASPVPPLAVDERDPKAGAVTAALAGNWRGTLEYRDYSNDKRVTLPTTLDAQAAEDGRSATLKFRYDEGKGRFVEGVNVLRIASKDAKLVWESDGGKIKSEYAVDGLDTFAPKPRGELVLTGTGTENDEKVDVRQTITLDGDDLTILRETRKPGAPFAFRNAYKLRRTSAPASGPTATSPRSGE